LLEQAVPLLQVARGAGRDHVLPHGIASAAPRHDVVEREPAAGRAAVDTTPTVAREERPPGDLALHGPRHLHVLHEPDHVRPGIRVARRPEWLVELLEHLGLALEDEHVRTADR